MAEIPLAALHAFCRDALRAVGVPDDAAALTADSLTQADARGLTSHGMARLLPRYIQRLQSGATCARPAIQVVLLRGNAALLDGGAGLGQVVGHAAMARAIALAREHGVGVVGVRNSTHFGTGAFFVEQAVRAGMIGSATSAPTRSRWARHAARSRRWCWTWRRAWWRAARS
jgi:LDH2 family malate/lactate/ureidoglycolate dehydrogenase